MNRLLLIHQNLTSDYTHIQVETIPEHNIGIIYLNSQSDLNSLSEPLKRDTILALKHLDNDNKIKVIIILSKVDKAFCAGANIKDLKNITLESQLTADIFEAFSRALDSIKKPLIIGVNGVALGGGLELTLYGDVIVATEDARLGLPELKLGVIPGIGGTQHLARLVGRTNAMRYVLTADQIPAQEAKDMGLVNFIVKKENLKEECIKIAKRISDKPLPTLILAKSAIKYSEEMPLSTGIRVERQLFDALLNTQGGKEGLQAFVEKRKPNFKDL